MIKLETHAHTREVSSCGRMAARQLAGLVADAGYRALVVTDHLHNDWRTEKSAFRRADEYLIGYRKAAEEGAKRGIHVLLGAELRLNYLGNEDFLTYGIAEGDIREVMRVLDTHPTLAQLHGAARDMGFLLYQAHPFRAGLTAQDPSALDGVEVYNGNPRHDSHNDMALRFAAENHLRMLSGSDAHRPEDVARGGILVPDTVADNASLVAFLRETKAPQRIEDGSVA